MDKFLARFRKKKAPVKPWTPDVTLPPRRLGKIVMYDTNNEVMHIWHTNITPVAGMDLDMTLKVAFR